jgi:hypothetical protein
MPWKTWPVRSFSSTRDSWSPWKMQTSTASAVSEYTATFADPSTRETPSG